MKLMFLGYGSNSFSNLNTVSFLIETDNRKILFECGNSTVNNLHEIIENFSEIDSVFISHSHFDHYLGLPYFIIGRHLDVITRKKYNKDYRPSDLHIYLPSELIEATQDLIRICHKDIKQISYNIFYHKLNTNSIEISDKLTIKPFNVNHTVETFGFSIIKDNDKIISYTSDTLYDDIILDNLRNSKYLILEGMIPLTENAFSNNAKHATFNQMYDVVKEIRPNKAFIVHLQPKYFKKIDEIISEFNNIPNSEIQFPKERYNYVLCV